MQGGPYRFVSLCQRYHRPPQATNVRFPCLLHPFMFENALCQRDFVAHSHFAWCTQTQTRTRIHEQASCWKASIRKWSSCHRSRVHSRPLTSCLRPKASHSLSTIRRESDGAWSVMIPRRLNCTSCHTHTCTQHCTALHWTPAHNERCKVVHVRLQC